MNKYFKVIIKVFIGITWFAAPITFYNACKARGVLIPGDLNLAAHFVWWGVGLGFNWYVTKGEYNYKSSRGGPSYNHYYDNDLNSDNNY